MNAFSKTLLELKTDFERLRETFSLAFISISGKRSGSIPEWEDRLIIHGTGNASLFRRRGPGDSAQRPPGKYSGKLTDATLLTLMDVLGRSGIESFQSDIPGPRDPVHFLRLRVSGRVFSFTWGSIRPPAPEGMLQLKRMLSELNVHACTQPNWSLRLKVAEFQNSKGAFEARLHLENHGSETIHVVHPAGPDCSPRSHFFLKYGEKQLIEEGFTPAPVEILTLPLLRKSDDAAELIAVAPGSPLPIEFAGTLAGHAERGWVGKFCWLHYLAEDEVAGVSVFNGALFTDEFQW